MTATTDHPALSVPCPGCGAPTGTACVASESVPLPDGVHHASRMAHAGRVAREARLLFDRFVAQSLAQDEARAQGFSVVVWDPETGEPSVDGIYDRETAERQAQSLDAWLNDTLVSGESPYLVFVKPISPNADGSLAANIVKYEAGQ